ncbi:MAG: hypothetical protein ACD_23C00226G0001 [uncultured bacterium]|nr:MAG: hypothetical protein ACD_23C00226G0001 [uncultured bacterium]
MQTHRHHICPFVVARADHATQSGEEYIWTAFACVGGWVGIGRVCGIKTIFEDQVLDTLRQRYRHHLGPAQFRHLEGGDGVATAFAAVCDVVDAGHVWTHGVDTRALQVLEREITRRCGHYERISHGVGDAAGGLHIGAIGRHGCRRHQICSQAMYGKCNRSGLVVRDTCRGQRLCLCGCQSHDGQRHLGVCRGGFVPPEIQQGGRAHIGDCVAQEVCWYFAVETSKVYFVV